MFYLPLELSGLDNNKSPAAIPFWFFFSLSKEWYSPLSLFDLLLDGYQSEFTFF